MWFAFYSGGAYNITIDGNEYYYNKKYALDPHSGTHDLRTTNYWLHHNPIGVICSDRCYNIFIKGNTVHHIQSLEYSIQEDCRIGLLEIIKYIIQVLEYLNQNLQITKFMTI